MKNKKGFSISRVFPAIAHNEEFTVKEVDMSKSGVVVYLSGDY